MQIQNACWNSKKITVQKVAKRMLTSTRKFTVRYKYCTQIKLNVLKVLLGGEFHMILSKLILGQGGD